MRKTLAVVALTSALTGVPATAAFADPVAAPAVAPVPASNHDTGDEGDGDKSGLLGLLGLLGLAGLLRRREDHHDTTTTNRNTGV